MEFLLQQETILSPTCCHLFDVVLSLYTCFQRNPDAEQQASNKTKRSAKQNHKATSNSSSSGLRSLDDLKKVSYIVTGFIFSMS